MCRSGCDGCGCRAWEQGDDAVPGLCPACAHWCQDCCRGWTWPSTLPGNGFSSSSPALLAMLWVPHPPKPSSFLGPSFCCNKEQPAGISQKRSGCDGCSSSVVLLSKSRGLNPFSRAVTWTCMPCAVPCHVPSFSVHQAAAAPRALQHLTDAEHPLHGPCVSQGCSAHG